MGSLSNGGQYSPLKGRYVGFEAVFGQLMGRANGGQESDRQWGGDRQ